jgi:hypothetical protein
MFVSRCSMLVFRCSVFRCSVFRCSVFDVRFSMFGFRCSVFDVRCSVFDVCSFLFFDWFSMSIFTNIEQQTSNIEYRTTTNEHRTTNIEQRKPNIEPQSSNIRNSNFRNRFSPSPTDCFKDCNHSNLINHTRNMLCAEGREEIILLFKSH